MVYEGSRYVGDKVFKDMDNNISYLDFINMDAISSSKDILYQWKSSDRLDILAYKYFGDATKGWIILMANPILYSEYDIVEGDYIVIPAKEGFN